MKRIAIIIIPLLTFGFYGIAQSSCEIYNKIIDTIYLRMNTVWVHADGSQPSLVNVFEPNIDTAAKKKEVLLSFVYIDSINISLDKPYYKSFSDLVKDSSIFDQPLLLTADQIKNCIRIDRFPYALYSENSFNIDYNSLEECVFNGKHYELSKESIQLSEIKYSKNNKAYVIAYLRKANSFSVWGFILVKRKIGNEMHWVVEKMSGEPVQ